MSNSFSWPAPVNPKLRLMLFYFTFLRGDTRKYYLKIKINNRRKKSIVLSKG